MLACWDCASMREWTPPHFLSLGNFADIPIWIRHASNLKSNRIFYFGWWSSRHIITVHWREVGECMRMEHVIW